MDYRIILPPQELRNVISHFWVGTWNVLEQPPNETYYIVANSLTEITFAFSSHRQHSNLLFSVVQGHTSLPNKLPVQGFYHLLGVAFYSYAIPTVFKMPSSELNEEFIALDTFLGYEGRVLNEKIATALTTEHRIKILSDYFIAAVRKQQMEDKIIIGAIKKIKASNGIIKVNELANDFCLSQKQFARRFRAFAGFSPKMYSRIIRFESVLQSYSNTSNLTDVAYANGYYDQAHFIHDFKTFTGYNPTAFWKIGEEHK
ncbi:helix-turn-helix domain-containing protein [Aureispira sp. CCB-QB1]|uniref:AraC family transcriptional regulator n=1 Tax=Aureispira sp. CCB-QB1 TaxID=1313421 RepID=UPI000695B651|nr:helix-turn-helix domain-containing protein [Aureispira sp. CCB-QB1]